MTLSITEQIASWKQRLADIKSTTPISNKVEETQAPKASVSKGIAEWLESNTLPFKVSVQTIAFLASQQLSSLTKENKELAFSFNVYDKEAEEEVNSPFFSDLLEANNKYLKERL